MMIPALMLLICFTVIAAADSLWAPTRPEAVLCSNLRRFFRGCRGFIEGYRMDASEGGVIRRRLFDSMMKSVPATIASLAKKKGAGLKPDELHQLSDSLQLVCLRLQAVELAHRRLREVDKERRMNLDQASQELKELVGGVLRDLSEFKVSGNGDAETEALKRISGDVETQFASDKDGKDTASPALHSLLISLRGLLSAFGGLRQTMGRFQWMSLSEARF